MAPQIDDESLARLAGRVGKRLTGRGATIATAESCTGGFIAKVLTDVAGSSAYLLEGFVTYSNAAKQSRLGVEPSLLSKHGAVSKEVARAMALGALERAGAHCAVAVTGIAGPGGAVAGKPVGTVWIGWATKTRRGIHVRSRGFQFRGDRDSVRRKTVRAALRGLLR